MATQTYVVPSGHTAAYIEPHSTLTNVIQIRLDSENGTIVTPFTNDSGMSIIDSGTNNPTGGFLFVDKVPAALKPLYDGFHQGIQVQGGSGGELELRASNADILIEIVDGTVPFVNVNSFTGTTRIGSGVSDLTIRTNNVQAARFRGGAGTGAEGTDVMVNGFSSGLTLSVDTGTGTYDRITLGQNNTIANEVTVKTGAGNCIVDLQQSDGDDGTTALVDFVGGQLGLGNKLIVHSVGTAMLANAPGSSSHMVYVDEVMVSGAGSNERGNVVVEHVSTIGTLQVANHGGAEITADATITTFSVDNGGTASIEDNATITTFTIDGTVDFTGTSAPSTVTQFQLTGNVSSATGVVNLLGGAAVTALANSRIGALNIGNGALFTLAERTGTPSHGTTVARVLTVKSLLILKAPDAPKAVLDLTDNAMIVDYSSSSPIAEVEAYITHAYNLNMPNMGIPPWVTNSVLHDGINSSTAADVAGTSAPQTGIGYGEASDLFSSSSTWEGQTVDTTSVLVKYTYYGDANLSGHVNLADFNRLAANFGGTEKRWTHGDFNYDDLVNLQDFNRLAANFGAGAAPAEQDDYTTQELEDMLPD